EVGYVHRQFRFLGYTYSPGIQVTVQAYNQQSMAWENLTVAISGNTANNPIGSPDMYQWEVYSQISNNANPSTWCRWTMDCSNPWVNPTSASANIRAVVGGTPVYTFEEGFEQCINVKYNTLGEDWIDAAQECSSADSPVATIHWIYDGP
ncbi:MAG: hypothetical protein RIF32_07370, partial [Leptospirales bacterium]